jgi:ABC-type sugar transport system ATPase subunit
MLLTALFGDEKILSGQIYIGGGPAAGLRQAVIHKIQDAINLGIGYLPSDRQQESVFGRLSVLANFNIIILKNYVRHILINVKKEQSHAGRYVDQLKIKTPSIQTNLENLSGGNQQKVVIARWLAKKPMLLLMDQPTRGVDVGAKQEIYRIIRTLASSGVSILFSSDELCEVIGLSNRICILKDGKISHTMYSPKEEKPSEELVIQYM